MYRAVQFQPRLGNGHWIVGAHSRPLATRFCARRSEDEPATELVFGLNANPRMPTSLFCTDSISQRNFADHVFGLAVIHFARGRAKNL